MQKALPNSSNSSSFSKSSPYKALSFMNSIKAMNDITLNSSSIHKERQNKSNRMLFKDKLSIKNYNFPKSNVRAFDLDSLQLLAAKELSLEKIAKQIATDKLACSSASTCKSRSRINLSPIPQTRGLALELKPIVYSLTPSSRLQSYYQQASPSTFSEFINHYQGEQSIQKFVDDNNSEEKPYEPVLTYSKTIRTRTKAKQDIIDFINEKKARQSSEQDESISNFPEPEVLRYTKTIGTRTKAQKDLIEFINEKKLRKNAQTNEENFGDVSPLANIESKTRARQDILGYLQEKSAQRDVQDCKNNAGHVSQAHLSSGMEDIAEQADGGIIKNYNCKVYKKVQFRKKGTHSLTLVHPNSYNKSSGLYQDATDRLSKLSKFGLEETKMKKSKAFNFKRSNTEISNHNSKEENMNHNSFLPKIQSPIPKDNVRMPIFSHKRTSSHFEPGLSQLGPSIIMNNVIHFTDSQNASPTNLIHNQPNINEENFSDFKRRSSRFPSQKLKLPLIISDKQSISLNISYHEHLHRDCSPTTRNLKTEASLNKSHLSPDPLDKNFMTRRTNLPSPKGSGIDCKPYIGRHSTKKSSLFRDERVRILRRSSTSNDHTKEKEN